MIDEKKKIQLARLAGHDTAMGHTYHVFNRRSGLFFSRFLYLPTVAKHSIKQLVHDKFREEERI